MELARYLLLLNMLALAACAGGPDVEIHPVPGASIGTFYTFEVIPDDTGPSIGPMRTREARARIEKALAEEMRRRGYREVESGADIQVEYVVSITREYQDEHRENIRFAGAVIDQHLPEPRELALTIGTLHVHLLHDGRALYEGIASDVFEGDISVSRIRNAVRALLAEVPPGPTMPAN